MTKSESRSQNHKVLIVDDEESILSAARRLFRGSDFLVETTQSPIDALKKIKEDAYSVVISDFRMPKMNGAEFLQEVKINSPLTTRMILTGFMEAPILLDAVNKAHVFRFISKPWDEGELVLAVKAALQHYRRKTEQNRYLAEVSQQNTTLEELTVNLESEVLKRTERIEESTISAKKNQRLVREITSFVKTLSQGTTVSEIAEAVFQELEKFRGLTTAALLILDSESDGKLIWRESRTVLEKRVNRFSHLFQKSSVRVVSSEICQWIGYHLKKDVSNVVMFPMRGREGARHPMAILFVSTKATGQDLSEFMERVTDRIQPVSVVLDRVRLHAQIELGRHQWEKTFNAFNDPIAVIDDQFQLVRFNDKFSSEKVRFCHEGFAHSENMCGGCPLPRAIQFMTSTTDLIRLENNKTYRVHSYPVKKSNAGSRKVVNYYKDLSEERNLYMKLVQSEKMAAVGLLAGNIAHELNNPLTGLRSLAQVILHDMKPTDPFYSDFKEIEQASQRCQNIIENLLNFSNPQTSDKPCYVNEVIVSTLPLLKTALRYHSLHTYLGENLPLVKIPFSQLQQVLFNLINNACQAMGETGTVIVTSEATPGGASITVSDKGPGIPAELFERIFESFYTTKGLGKGTGLGLSVSKSIVEKYGGRLTLKSTLGEGTEFTVTLPAVEKGEIS